MAGRRQVDWPLSLRLLAFDQDDINSSLFRNLDHVFRSFAAWEGDNQLRIFFEHLLVSDRASTTAIFLPVSRMSLYFNPSFRRPLPTQSVGTTGIPMNQNGKMMYSVKPIKGFKKQLSVAETTASGNENTHDE